ncbi:MAG TPA: alpha/beta hydrolase family protein [Pyrinomonadaceae bacterium]|nr:alpha/beta hydrolase family protein [Pyrinomonadaceae bacterium]
MAKVISGSLQSRLIQRALPYRVIIPTTYELSEKQFPVLYLLHGLFGNCDNWIELTDILEHIEQHELLIVAPDSGNSWYTDSATTENDKFESYLTAELVPEIERSFRVNTTRDGRAVAGISMGGYGAFKLALRRPELFIFAAASSGAFHAAKMNAEICGDRWPEYEESITRAFGEPGSETRMRNDAYTLVSEVNNGNASALPFLYFDCGNQDGFLYANREFAEQLKNKKIAHDYRELTGSHEWPYWNERVKEILDAVDNIFA